MSVECSLSPERTSLFGKPPNAPVAGKEEMGGTGEQMVVKPHCGPHSVSLKGQSISEVHEYFYASHINMDFFFLLTVALALVGYLEENCRI